LVFDFTNGALELVLVDVYFFMNGHNVLFYSVLKGSQISTQFLIGFFLAGGNHDRKRGGSMESKKELKTICMTMIMVKREIIVSRTKRGITMIMKKRGRKKDEK